MTQRLNLQTTRPLAGWMLVAVLAAAVLCSTTAIHSQEAQAPAPTPAATPTQQPTPIPASEIPGRAAAIGPILRDATSTTDFSQELGLIGEDFEKENEHISELEEETLRRLETEGPASVIEETENAWIRLESRLDGWMNTLSGHADLAGKQLDKLSKELALWRLTESSAEEVKLPEAVRNQVEETMRAIERADRSVRRSRDDVLTLQAEVARQTANTDDLLAMQREEISRRRHSVVGIDSPPIWAAFGVPGVDGAPSEQAAAIWEKNSQAVREYALEQQATVLRHFLFLVAIVTVLLLLRKRAELWAQQDRSLKATVRVLDRPVAAGLVITILLGRLLHPGAPSAWIDILGLILLLALLRLLPLMLPQALRPAGYLLAILFFLDQVTQLTPDGNLLNRLALLLLSVTAAAVSVWFGRKIDHDPPSISEGWLRVLRLGSRATFLAFVVGAIADIVGSVGFATLIINGVLSSVYLAVLYWVAAVLLGAAVRVGMLTGTARRSGVVQFHADTVRSTLFKGVQLLAVIGWVIGTLDRFGALDSVAAWVRRVLAAEVTFGDLTIIPADIAIFVIIIWLSFKISRLLRFLLDTDVMPHMNLPRGVSGAVDRLTHYTVIVVGLVIAATAAGLDFGRVTLIVGALGVGIGFGLQGVVNNFVSGLILLFERPIRVGDKVQVDQLLGIVTRIGMRASIVRTYQGAEVIVPNANLISAEVINWTLSDDRRRMEIPAGVAYGTDPARVIELLVGVAAAHEEVLEDPAPKAIFTGFGASSLDFELRAWTRGDFVEIASDLRVGINRALADAGITIPFPQQDLHLRTVDAEVREALSPGEWEEPRREGDETL